MLDFIIYNPSSASPLIPMWIPLIGGLPINSPLVGSFLGVLFAFAFNYGAHFLKDKKERNYYKNMFKNEVGNAISILDHERLDIPTPLPTDRWISAINSGALRLFELEEIEKLSRFYNRIKLYNIVLENFHFYREDDARSLLKKHADDIKWEYTMCIVEADRLRWLYQEELEKIKPDNRPWWQFWK